MGLVLGLVPKGNLLALLIATVVFSLRLNLAAAMLSTLAFSFVGPLLDPMTHRLGEVLLTQDGLHGLWTTIYQLPLAPWTNFNNTVVLGSLLIGAAAAAPWYFVSKLAFQRWQGFRSKEHSAEVGLA